MNDVLKESLRDCSKELDDIKEKIGKRSPLDKTRLYLTQYALIKACGTVEYVYRSIVADFFEESSPVQIHNYLDKTIRSGSMSATYENMKKLLAKFGEEWKKDFELKLKTRSDWQKFIDSSNSLVTDRHAFAHGKATSVVFSDVYQYYNDVLELIGIIDDVINCKRIGA